MTSRARAGCEVEWGWKLRREMLRCWPRVARTASDVSVEHDCFKDRDETVVRLSLVRSILDVLHSCGDISRTVKRIKYALQCVYSVLLKALYNPSYV